MAQVLTSENMQEFITNGRVAEFKPPEAPKEEPKAQAATPEAKTDEPKGEAPEVKTDAEDDDGSNDPELTEKFRRKIGAKHRAMREAEEFAEAQYNERRLAESRAEKAEAALAALQAEVKPPPVEGKQKPEAKDFKDAIEYAEALAEFTAEQAVAKERARQAEEAAERERERALIAWRKKITETVKEIPDFEEVTSMADVKLPGHVILAIQESDIGPKIGYHLAKHPELLERITQLSPVKAVAEIGKLEAAIEAGGKVKTLTEAPTVASERSRAPAPIQPIKGESTPVVKDPAQMSFKELREHNRQKRMAKH